MYGFGVKVDVVIVDVLDPNVVLPSSCQCNPAAAAAKRNGFIKMANVNTSLGLITYKGDF